MIRPSRTAIFILSVYMLWFYFTTFNKIDKNESSKIKSISYSKEINTNGRNIITKKLKHITRGIDFANLLALREMSDEFQHGLKLLQSPPDCSTTHLKCGHDYACGLGCQIHHRVVCLILSYNLDIPLIHDEANWPHRKKWSEVFLPLGSHCSPEKLESWVTVHWQFSGVPILEKSDKNNIAKQSEFIPYPLTYGLKIPQALNEIALRTYKDGTFKWWIGQFLKYALRLAPEEEELVHLRKEMLGFPRKTVGVHIRRTDKISENVMGMQSYHSTLEYFRQAGKFFSNENITDGRRVFIATDDHVVFQKAKARFGPPTWEVIGLSLNTTKHTQVDRLDSLDDSIVDLMILAECDFVVCVQTSNWCWLLDEMMYYKHDDATERIKSLSGRYLYILKGHSLPERVNEI